MPTRNILYNKATPTTAPIITIASLPSLTTPAAPVAVLEADEPEADTAVGVREEVLKTVPFPTTDVSITSPPDAVPVAATAATELNVALAVVEGTTATEDTVLNFPLTLALTPTTFPVEDESAEATLVQLPIAVE